jgi:hypothetical protein
MPADHFLIAIDLSESGRKWLRDALAPFVTVPGPPVAARTCIADAGASTDWSRITRSVSGHTGRVAVC